MLCSCRKRDKPDRDLTRHHGHERPAARRPHWWWNDLSLAPLLTATGFRRRHGVNQQWRRPSTLSTSPPKHTHTQTNGREKSPSLQAFLRGEAGRSFNVSCAKHEPASV
ncbi:hypothetical protein LZ31DRAFT_307789 [Colletotrichum somersetense]|nr:hypothetical protein LZ31DRAFT_307789 [Colletotrichum somersetense]